MFALTHVYSANIYVRKNGETFASVEVFSRIE